MNSMGARMPMSFTPMQAGRWEGCFSTWGKTLNPKPQGCMAQGFVKARGWEKPDTPVFARGQCAPFITRGSLINPVKPKRCPFLQGFQSLNPKTYYALWLQVQNMQTSADDPGQPGTMAWALHTSWLPLLPPSILPPPPVPPIGLRLFRGLLRKGTHEHPTVSRVCQQERAICRLKV